MLGKAALAMWCDVEPGHREEFDDWHTHEHMAERVSIPGFLRGSRWVAADAQGGYFLLYETQSEATITAGPYLERLNNPSAWSQKIMPHHRYMVRSLCRVVSSFGTGVGGMMQTVRFSPRPGAAQALEAWLSAERLPGLPARKGLAGASLLRTIASPRGGQTTEQQMRGGDTAADWIALVNGYSAEALRDIAAQELGEAAMVAHGAMPGSLHGLYRLAYVLAVGDLESASPGR